MLGLACWAIFPVLAVASECLRRPRGCPPWIRRLGHSYPSASPGGPSSSLGSGRPMAYPPPCLACNGLSRHILGRKLPPVFHDPLHAAQLWIVRAYRDRPTLTSRPPPAARSRVKGLAAPAARTRLKAFVYRLQHSASEQPRRAAASSRKGNFSHARKGIFSKLIFYR